jgi:hypothetical protein
MRSLGYNCFSLRFASFHAAAVSAVVISGTKALSCTLNCSGFLMRKNRKVWNRLGRPGLVMHVSKYESYSHGSLEGDHQMSPWIFAFRINEVMAILGSRILKDCNF